MILRRLYLYLVSAAALLLLTAGLALLGSTLVAIAFNDSSANRVQLAGFTAMTVVALPVWGVHFWFAQRFARRDPYERSSAVRRAYIYGACLVLSVAAMVALSQALTSLLQPVLDNTNFNGKWAAQDGWNTVVFTGFWALHFYLGARDRAAVPEEGASSTLRRWYMYTALLIGFLTMLAGTQQLLQLAWGSWRTGTYQFTYLSSPAANLIAGAALWGVHARAIALGPISQDRHSTLRAVEGFLALTVSIAIALFGASQILYYVLARVLGVSNPGGASNDPLTAAAGPVSQLLVYGVAWFLIRQRLERDAGTQEADRQAAVRRLYTNLASLVSLGAWAVGAGGVLWTLAEQLESPIIGVTSPDWKNPISLWATLLVVGAVVWVAHWRDSPWAADRQSLSRRLYVWAALLVSILAMLAGGIGTINALLQQLFSAHPRLNDPTNLDFGHYLAVIVVAAGVGLYHLRVLRADTAARPPKPAAKPVAVVAQAAAAPATMPAPAHETLGPHARRYLLVVTDATEDDVHQALSNLPPQASYNLTPTEQAVDGH